VHILPFILTLVVMLSGIGYWLYRICRSPLPTRKQLACFYGAESLCLVLLVDVFHHVYSSQAFSLSVLDHLPAANGLFLFPLLYLLFMCALEARNQSWRRILAVLTVYLLFFFSMIGLWSAKRAGCQVSEQLLKVITSLYNLILFSNVLIFGVLILYRGYHYRLRVVNVFSDKSQSDFTLVRCIGWSSLTVGFILYLMMCVGILTLQGNHLLLVLLCLPVLFILNFIGYCVAHLRGATIPAVIDWSVRNLSDEQLETLERRFHLIDEVKQAQDATLNISATLELWLGDPRKPFLRQGLTVNDVAEQTSIPAKILSTYLNKTLELNFNQWINQHRLKEVKIQLLTTDRTLDDIAADCGFTDRSAMSRIFKQAEGLSPTEFRNRR